jgi:FAD:protein FMN transferase
MNNPPRPVKLYKSLSILAVLGVAIFFYTQRRPAEFHYWNITGAAWSPYSVKLIDHRFSESHVTALQSEIDVFLDSVNRQMSTYIPDSEISQFNHYRDTTEYSVSPAFAEVTRRAIEICRQTGGAFNPTLDRLINIWGFGHQGPRREPTEEELSTALALVGCDNIEVLPGHALRKTNPDVTLNVNAIVEGWAVDQVALLLEQKGVTNYFVEIGGEVRASGFSEKLRPWRVGIDRPVEGAMPGEQFDIIVEVDHRGLATSGNYRNFMVNENGHKVSHILDPRRGRPAESPLASVSVIAPDCATADAMATALFVMGTEEGLSFVESQTGIDAAFIEYATNGTYQTTFSRGFTNWLVNTGEL